MNQLRAEIGRFLRFTVPNTPATFDTKEVAQKAGYRQLRIQYKSVDGDAIPAFLLLPDGERPFAGVLVHHQHHGQRHWGKGESLMQKVLQDSAQGISLLRAHPQIDSERIGLMGHSYGGSTTLFHAALDLRIRFACSSGAVCSYAHRISAHLGIEMSAAIPSFVQQYDLPDLVACIAPRPFMIVSATEDAHSQDATRVIQLAVEKCRAAGVPTQVTHKRYNGKHALTEERFAAIVDWLAAHG